MRPASPHNAGFGGNGQAKPVWAITAFFNPIADGRRLPQYHEFRRRLGIPLVAVELSFDDRFELGPGDADILIRLRGGSVLWQKERLLNIALDALPGQCDTVAWLDSDIVFANPHWHLDARRMLGDFALVQPFRKLHHLGPCDPPEVPTGTKAANGVDSVVYCAAQGRLPAASFRTPGLSQVVGYAPGMAWVTRREILAKHRFYDAAIVGGGDKLILAAAWGRYDDIIHAAHMNEARAFHYRAWAKPFHQTVGGRLGYLDGEIAHLWHGDLADRRYVERLDVFDLYDFDPAVDLALTPDGVWRWATDRPDLHEHVRRHFELLALYSTRSPVVK